MGLYVFCIKNSFQTRFNSIWFAQRFAAFQCRYGFMDAVLGGIYFEIRDKLYMNSVEDTERETNTNSQRQKADTEEKQWIHKRCLRKSHKTIRFSRFSLQICISELESRKLIVED